MVKPHKHVLHLNVMLAKIKFVPFRGPSIYPICYPYYISIPPKNITKS